MSLAKFEAWLRRLTWASVVGCVALVLATAAIATSPRLRSIVGLDHRQQAYRIGDYIDAPSSTYDRTPHTVLLFARANCVACQNATPVLSGLVANLAENEVAVRVLTPATNREHQVDYVTSLGLGQSDLVEANLRSMRVRVVPTAVLVDRQGRILSVSEGGGRLDKFSSEVLSRFGRR